MMLLILKHHRLRIKPEEDLIDFGVRILGKSLVKHGDKSLLNSRLALCQGIAEKFRGDLVEEKGEKFGLQPANVT